MPKVADKPAKKAAKKAPVKKAPAKKAEPKAEGAKPGREPKDLTKNTTAVMQVMRDGNIRIAAEIREATGIEKGIRLPELVEKGYLKELVPEEGKRGKRFQITATGRKALDKALKNS